MGPRREVSPTRNGPRKRPKLMDKRRTNLEANEKRIPDETTNNVTLRPEASSSLSISSIPVEILLNILSYLSCRDLYAMRGVSKFFERLVLDTSVWTDYEVNASGPCTSDVIGELKRMPYLKRISIEARNDCDDILRQLSCTNRRLQRLGITDCTGSTANLYLRPLHLTRILEKCTRLHTITIKGSRFRGLKFYRLLGNIGHRLRFVSVSITCKQFTTFAKHVTTLEQRDVDTLCSMCTSTSQWGPLCYYMVERSDRTKIALISYFYQDFLYLDVRPLDADRGKTTPSLGVASFSSTMPTSCP